MSTQETDLTQAIRTARTALEEQGYAEARIAAHRHNDGPIALFVSRIRWPRHWSRKARKLAPQALAWSLEEKTGCTTRITR